VLEEKGLRLYKLQAQEGELDQMGWEENIWNWTMQVDAIFALNGALALGSPCAVANSNTMFFVIDRF